MRLEGAKRFGPRGASVSFGARSRSLPLCNPLHAYFSETTFSLGMGPQYQCVRFDGGERGQTKREMTPSHWSDVVRPNNRPVAIPADCYCE